MPFITHTLTHIQYIRTYIQYIRTYIQYIRTYIQYIRTYIHTYVHTYIQPDIPWMLASTSPPSCLPRCECDWSALPLELWDLILRPLTCWQLSQAAQTCRAAAMAARRRRAAVLARAMSFMRCGGRVTRKTRGDIDDRHGHHDAEDDDEDEEEELDPNITLAVFGDDGKLIKKVVDEILEEEENDHPGSRGRDDDSDAASLSSRVPKYRFQRELAQVMQSSEYTAIQLHDASRRVLAVYKSSLQIFDLDTGLRRYTFQIDELGYAHRARGPRQVRRPHAEGKECFEKCGGECLAECCEEEEPAGAMSGLTKGSVEVAAARWNANGTAIAYCTENTRGGVLNVESGMTVAVFEPGEPSRRQPQQNIRQGIWQRNDGSSPKLEDAFQNHHDSQVFGYDQDHVVPFRKNVTFNHVDFSPDGDLLLVTGYGFAALFSLRHNAWVTLFPMPRATGYVTHGAFSPLGDLVITASIKGILLI